MNCYTVTKGGGVKEGIAAFKNADGHTVHIGEPGRGRQLTVVPLPQGTKASNERVTFIPTSGESEVVVAIRDQSGYRGGWAADFPEEVTVIAEGFCAQGAAGRMGGGPEYLIRGPVGSTFTIRRKGRLYGAPAELNVTLGAPPSVTDAKAAERSREAASRF
jgi:hypothetical protein